MISFLFTLLMLTTLFTVTSILTFIFRKLALKGRERIMYYIWLAVLILAVLPLRIGQPRLTLSLESNYHNHSPDTVIISDLLPAAPSDTSQKEPNQFSTPTEQSKSDTETPYKHSYNFNFTKLKKSLPYILTIIWITGSTLLFLKSMHSYFKMKKLFLKESAVCSDDRINLVFAECLATANIRKPVKLRVMKLDFAPPCVCGLMNPTVFADSSCYGYSDKKLRYIFTHELYHVKRYDMIYKIFALAVVSVHWFNPIAYKVIKAVNEDCELSVDGNVINSFGDGDYYMNVILDIAELKCSAPTVQIPYTSLFLGEKGNVNLLKRRYNNMKNAVNKKSLIAISSLFLTAILIMNTFIMSSCKLDVAEANTNESASPSTNENTNDTSSVPVEIAADSPSLPAECPDASVFEEAIRNYFKLLPDEQITDEHLAEITNITIIKSSIPDENTVYYDDGKEFDSYITFSIDAEGYYTNFPSLLTLYPADSIPFDDASFSATSMVISSGDKNSTPYTAFGMYRINGEGDDSHSYFALLLPVGSTLLPSTVTNQDSKIDLSYLTQCPNLTDINLKGITAVNADVLPDTVTVTSNP